MSSKEMALSLRNQIAHDYDEFFALASWTLRKLEKSGFNPRVIKRKRRRLLRSHERALKYMKYSLLGDLEYLPEAVIDWQKYYEILLGEKRVLEELEAKFSLVARVFRTN